MQCKSHPKCSHESTKQQPVKIFEEYKKLSYEIDKFDLNIKLLEQITEMLKYLYNGYLEDFEVREIIKEVDALKWKLIENKTTSIGQSFQIETNLLNLIKLSNENPEMEG